MMWQISRARTQARLGLYISSDITIHQLAAKSDESRWTPYYKIPSRDSHQHLRFMTIPLIYLLVAVALGCAVFSLRFSQRETGLPPGPPTVPLVGNLHLLPKMGKLHLKFMEWSRKYGDIVSIKTGSGTMVVLSSPTAIKQVVDKQGWAASSRPANHLADLAAGGYHILFAPDTARLRSIRKTITRFLGPQSSLNRVSVQEAESSQLLNELMTQPENFSESIRRYTHSTARISIYGQRVSSLTTPGVQRFYKILHRFLHISVPGVYPPVDLFPALKYLPERYAPWIAACRRSKSELVKFHAELSMGAKERSTQPNADHQRDPSFMEYISNMGLSEEEYSVSAYGGFTLMEAGSHTIAAFLLSLILILALHPEPQERAREEIESVVGSARLPELDDFKKMPFVDALMKEVVRIRPPFPIGVPHATTSEIRYKNYVLPKNTTVILNIYSIFHNPDIFEDHDVFNPDRFMQTKFGTRPGMDIDFRDNFLFGAGRRICPAQHVAHATMQIVTMRLLWAFQFRSAVDAQTGRPLTRKLDCYAPEFVTMPHPFKCVIELCGEEQRGIITQAFKNAKSVLGAYENENLKA
ncbi:cytochrome P450 [Mycena maculata]|uniref:Cytochrome P450 n=1 Tax=Mycena maculata TaxID=230809 RepID=A0AAD7I988_9AGAR|nr:cytochrome P450 [Mycena maculata]